MIFEIQTITMLVVVEQQHKFEILFSLCFLFLQCSLNLFCEQIHLEILMPFLFESLKHVGGKKDNKSAVHSSCLQSLYFHGLF